MNSLIAQNSTIIGSTEDIADLEKKSNAKLLVLADSHGAVDAVKDIILNFGSDVDALIYCGDGFCDIIECIEESIHDEKIRRALPPVIIPVKGNCDSDMYPATLQNDESDDVYTKFFLNVRQSCIIAGRTVFAVHGDRYGVDMGTETLVNAAHAIDADIVFFAHTHCAYWEETGGTLLLNPGSCSRSRSKHPPGFAVVSFPGEQNRFDITYFGIEKSVFKNHTFIPMPIHSD